jgi:hypothetical protein
MPGRSLKRTVLVWSVAWVALIASLHAWLNLDFFRSGETAATQFRVGFLPVT